MDENHALFESALYNNVIKTSDYRDGRSGYIFELANRSSQMAPFKRGIACMVVIRFLMSTMVWALVLSNPCVNEPR